MWNNNDKLKCNAACIVSVILSHNTILPKRQFTRGKKLFDLKHSKYLSILLIFLSQIEPLFFDKKYIFVNLGVTSQEPTKNLMHLIYHFLIKLTQRVLKL